MFSFDWSKSAFLRPIAVEDLRFNFILSEVVKALDTVKVDLGRSLKRF